MSRTIDTDTFKQHLKEISQHQRTLMQIYSETIGLVDQVAFYSKSHMEQISDIEEGLFDTHDVSKEILQNNLSKLTENIKAFNAKINSARRRFNEAILKMIESLEVAIVLAESENKIKEELMQTRKVLMYLNALIRKFKAKIVQLQLMSNILFSISQEMRAIQDEYKTNLNCVNTEMAVAIEKCREIVKRIDAI